MIDLEQLDRELEEATIDKSDLFDFYNKNWDSLVAEIKELRLKLGENYRGECDECGSDGTNGRPTFPCKCENNDMTGRCSDCGILGETTGHQTCQYPRDHE